jgi:hypothetical protein
VSQIVLITLGGDSPIDSVNALAASPSSSPLVRLKPPNAQGPLALRPVAPFGWGAGGVRPGLCPPAHGGFGVAPVRFSLSPPAWPSWRCRLAWNLLQFGRAEHLAPGQEGHCVAGGIVTGGDAVKRRFWGLPLSGCRSPVASTPGVG